ncbi:hypothetical protein ACROYT_G001926 [Oculina patagonica]
MFLSNRKQRKQLKEAAERIARLQEQLQLENELLQNNEISLQRQRSVCEMDLAALKLKHEACQFGQFLKANPVEEWTVCSLPNLYFTEL